MKQLESMLGRWSAHTSYEAEWGWIAGRFGVVAVAGIATPLFLRETPSFGVVLGLLGLVIAYNSILLLLLARSQLHTVFALGLMLDNVVLLGGWMSVTSSLAGDQMTNDLWLVLIPVVIVGVLRMGWVMGLGYMALWLAFMSWSFIHFYGPDSYDAKQLPVRIGFTVVIVGLVMRLTSLITRQREREHERLAAIERMEELKSTLLRAVAHDVRSPMTAVRAASEMLTDDTIELTPEQRGRLGAALRRGLARLDRTVKDSLSYAELKAGGAELEFDDLDLASTVESVVQMMSGVAEQRGLCVDAVGVERPMMVNGDRAWLIQMLTNLVTNAVEHASDGSTVSVCCRMENRTAAVDVVNEGEGIPPSEQKAIFEEYYRGAEPDRRGMTSSGLGLAFAKRVAERHGGTIEVDSPPDGPTTFTVTLPLRTGC